LFPFSEITTIVDAFPAIGNEDTGHSAWGVCQKGGIYEKSRDNKGIYIGRQNKQKTQKKVARLWVYNGS